MDTIFVQYHKFVLFVIW